VDRATAKWRFLTGLLGLPLIPPFVPLAPARSALRSDRPTRANRVLDASVSSDRRAQVNSQAKVNRAGISAARDVCGPPVQAGWTQVVIGPRPSLNGATLYDTSWTSTPSCTASARSKRRGSVGFRRTMTGRKSTARCPAMAATATPTRSIGEPGWRPPLLLDRLRSRVVDGPRPLGPPSLGLLGLVRGGVQLDETINRLGQAPPVDRRDRLLGGPHPLVAQAEQRPGLGVRPDG